MTKETFTCPHGTSYALIGSDHEYYCRECKSLIFSKEETEKEEVKLNNKYVTTK